MRFEADIKDGYVLIANIRGYNTSEGIKGHIEYMTGFWNEKPIKLVKETKSEESWIVEGLIYVDGTSIFQYKSILCGGKGIALTIIYDEKDKYKLKRLLTDVLEEFKCTDESK